MRIARFIVIALAAIALLAAITLALPVRVWRSGELRLPPLAYEPIAADFRLPRRIWIDTDAACGSAARIDADDCLAIVALANEPRIEIAGISTVFGNAARETADKTVHALVERLASPRIRSTRLHPGADAPIAEQTPPPGVAALRAALEQGPLTIVALGPLTNVAAALAGRADLRSNVQCLIAVMGRRPGHLFHPGEGADAESWFGHGPVFRDFNVAKDTRAAGTVIALHLPLVLVPYDAARMVEITGADLDRLQQSSGAAAWAAERSRAWLRYWTGDMGRRGFYPFDWVAAAYAIDPRRFMCAPVRAWVGDDPLQYFPSLMPQALLVEQGSAYADDDATTAPARYCKPAAGDFKDWLVDALAVRRPL